MDANGLAHGSSPHTRGARMGRVHDPRRRRIIPAYAGSTTATAPLARKGRDHPRIRGEHQPTHDTPATTRGSSPHTRGARIGSAAPATSVGIIPAYAGSTTTNAPYHLAGADHPRIRGEHEPNTNDAQSEAGSSPHTRGARAPETAPRGRRRIIPAYAGSTAPAYAPRLRGADHPRIRGEHPGT